MIVHIEENYIVPPASGGTGAGSTIGRNIQKGVDISLAHLSLPQNDNCFEPKYFLSTPIWKFFCVEMLPRQRGTKRNHFIWYIGSMKSQLYVTFK